MEGKELLAEREMVNTPEEPRETYVIFDYMRKHPAVLATCASAAIAVGSFLVTMLAFAFQERYILAWNIDFQPVELTGKGHPYFFIVATLIYCVAISLLGHLFERIFQAHYHNTAFFRYNKWRLKRSRETWRALQRRLRRLQKRVKKMRGAEKEELQAELGGVGEEIAACRKEEDELRKELDRDNAKQIRSLVLAIFATSAFLLLPLLLFFFSVSGVSASWEILPVWLGLLFVVSLSGAASAKLDHPEYAPGKIRKELRAAEKELKTQAEETPGSAEKHRELIRRLGEKGRILSTTPLPRMTPKSLFSDMSLASMAGALFTGCLSLLLILTLMSQISTFAQKTFWLYQEDGQLYVLVYQDTEHCILKAADINGQTLTIDTQNQLVRSGDGLVTRQQAFSEVIRLPQKEPWLQRLLHWREK